MKRAARRQAWLLLVVAALLLAVWWQNRSDRPSTPAALLSLSPEQITRVSLTIAHTPAETYVRHGQQDWQTDQARPVRADPQRLRELLRIAAAPVQNWRPASHYDLAKIGLAPPQATLTLNDKTLRFGTLTAIGHNLYVQVGPYIGIASLGYMPHPAPSASVRVP